MGIIVINLLMILINSLGSIHMQIQHVIIYLDRVAEQAVVVETVDTLVAGRPAMNKSFYNLSCKYQNLIKFCVPFLEEVLDLRKS